MTDRVVERTRGKIRDKPISARLRRLLNMAAEEARIDEVSVTSGGQPGSTGRSTGSKRHNSGHAADLQLIVGGRALSFNDQQAPPQVTNFVSAACKNGATGVGAGIGYMGSTTIHVGFGLPQTVWGARGRRANAPQWLIRAAEAGWGAMLVPIPGFVVMARNGARLYEGPGIEFGAVERIQTDTRVSVLQIDGPNKDWARVDLLGDGYVDGHIHISLLSKLNAGEFGLDSDNDEAEVDLDEHSHSGEISEEGGGSKGGR